MARDLQHLPLPSIRQPLPARKQGGGKRGKRENRGEHGTALDLQAQSITEQLEHRVADAPKGINPRLVFKIRFSREFGELDEEQLRKLGLTVLAREPSKAVVVFPDDAKLAELRRRLHEYSGQVPDGHQYAELDSIEELLPLGREDRIGRRLRAEPLGPNEIAPLDVELWHPGDQVGCRRQIREVEQLLRTRDLPVTDWWVGSSLCVLRAKVNAEALDALLDIDYVKEVDRRPAPDFEMLPVWRGQLDDFAAPNGGLPDDAAGIVVVDSGVMGAHPLLGPVLGDAQVFPDRLRARVKGGAEDGDEATGGHGTAVAGIAVYSDVGHCIKCGAFTPTARLFSARVTNDQNEYDPDELLEHQLEAAVRYFLDNYPTVRVINFSLGDPSRAYVEGQYQFRVAAAIDELAYRYRDREVVFVISAGNYWPGDEFTGEEALNRYPTYLFDAPEARLIDPATAAIALTVGGLSYGAGEMEGLNEMQVDRLLAGERGWPSPFTRAGLGVNGAIKPEVVDYAGDTIFERGRLREQPLYAGIPSTNKAFAPPEGRLFRTVAGTSFAAPRVANLAARLFTEFPGSSSNLVRALIASSARIPDSLPPALKGFDETNEAILRLYGYGQPAFERARWSSEQEVLLIADDTMDVGTFRLYSVPALPEEFFTARGAGQIDVTLAYDPPTRHTRADNYLGIGMETHLFRNLSPEQVADLVRVWDQEELVDLEIKRPPSRTNAKERYGVVSNVELKPGVNTRKRGTLQRGTCRIAGAQWNYDGKPLVLAVLCRRIWAPEDIAQQRFAVVVTLSHPNQDIRLHTHIREQLRLQPRVRAHL